MNKSQYGYKLLSGGESIWGMNELSLLTSQTLKSLDMAWGDQRSSSRDYTYYKGVVKRLVTKWHNLDWGESFL